MKLYSKFERISEDHWIRNTIERCSCEVFGKVFTIYCGRDKADLSDNARIYIQIQYTDHCIHNQMSEEWHGRKFYLSEHMTPDEVMKTVFAAFDAAVKHEVMEGFKIDNVRPFNPHVDIEELLKVSNREVTRK